MSKKRYTIGVEYGTNSVRAIVVDVENGKELGTAVFNYPSGEDGIIVDPGNHHLARQNPQDYLDGLEYVVRGAIAQAAECSEFSPQQVIGMGVDTTGSTPIPVDHHNRPLAFDPAFRDNPAAQAWLWKDHTAAEEAEEITAKAREHRPQYLSKCGFTYSSEWFWSKILHCLRTAPDVFAAAYSWVECADYIPAVLAGVDDPKAISRSVCAAGHKAMYCEEWGGLPDKEFLAMLDPQLADLRDRLYEHAYAIDHPAGTLCAEWAAKLGLPEGIPIATGAFDAHLGAVGAGVKEGTLVKIIGTSTCDCMVAPLSARLPDIPGICGIVNGSIVPGFYGIEAGQSAVGDIFKWFVEKVCEGDAALHGKLTEEARTQLPGQSGLLALDWNNGNRTILVDPKLVGLLVGQTLHTTRAEIYRALIEATGFGARAIIERIKSYQVPIREIVCCGGIAEKNPMLMQIYADITNCRMLISASSQTCALGAAIAGAVVAGEERGGYADVPSAQQAMTRVKPQSYEPIAENRQVYDELFALYMQLHDSFGNVKVSGELGQLMKRLLAIKERQQTRKSP